MAEVNLKIHGRSYPILCDDGQEPRIEKLAAYIDQRVQEIAQSGAAVSDNHLLVLTSLILADEVFEMRDHGGDMSMAHDNDEAIGETLRSFSSRISMISHRLKNL